MDPLSTFPQPRPVRAVPPNVAAGEPPHAGPGPNPANVGIEYSRRSDGLQQMTFIDMRTGVVISQTPAPQVLAVVDSIVAAIRRREA
jgi:hypothetical protein